MRLIPVGTLVTRKGDVAKEVGFGVVVGYPFAHNGYDDVFVVWWNNVLGILEFEEVEVIA